MHFNSENEHHMIDILFVLTLFGVFAISALTLVIMGAKIYKSTVDHMNVNYSSRTAYAYITQKIRQQDREDSVSVGTFDGCTAIIMEEEINDTLYCTYLYEYEGQLYELLTRADQSDMKAEFGSPIMEIQSFQAKQISPNLYEIDIVTLEDDSISFHLSTHCSSKESM